MKNLQKIADDIPPLITKRIILFTGDRRAKKLSKYVMSIVDSADVVVHGGAIGFDTLVNNYAKSKNKQIMVFRPDYNKYDGKIAPLKRNLEMIKISTMCLAAIQDSDGDNDDKETCKDRGTSYTANNALKAGLPVIVVDHRFEMGGIPLTKQLNQEPGAPSIGLTWIEDKLKGRQ